MTERIITEKVKAAAAEGFLAAQAGDTKASLEAMAQGSSIEALIISNIEHSDADAVRAAVLGLALEALEDGDHDAVLGLLLRLAKMNVTLSQLRGFGLL